MRPLAAVVPAVLALALAAALGGCGGGTSGADETRYAQAVNEAQHGFARTLDRLSTSITATSTPRQDRRTLRSFARAVDAAVVELRRVTPPDRVKDLHGRLVGQVASYGRPIATARSAFATEDPRLIVAAQGRFVGAVTRTGERVNRTIAAINERLRS
jgi:hypothetical protein